ncbi:angiopoietin-4-like isoform X1 [Crassostrea angulata]|uniref:angiopoietin-4-like isoform X1 n=1 Tax=Magallana angulata TaxID=2784310 RepID=UPI0022B1F718|nr:angiopoietin-4-like isoform X1 [Crassostrea angulata]
MGSLFEISILISLFAIVNGNVVIDELKDKQTSVDSALKFMKIGLQEFSEGIEQMVMKRLEGVETIVDEKIKQMIGNATRSIIEDQSTDQKKTSENLLSTFQTEQRQKIESPTRYVDKKISDQLFTTQIEQRLFRQELISVTASLFGKLERISDVLSKTQNEQQILNQKIMSLSTNFSETVDQKIIDLTSTAQTERQQQLRQNIEFLAINLTKAIEGKLSDVLWTTQTEQPLLCRKIEYFTTNLTENIKEKIIEVLSTTHTEQQVLNKKIESLLTNFSENVDKKVSDKLSSIQTEQHILKQEVFSLTANLVGKIEGIRNTSMYVAEQLSSGKALNMIRNVENISQFLLKVHVIAGSDCADILEKYPKTRWENGVYYITASSYKTKAVFCDMTTNNGGWTVIQRRVNGSVDFYRNWTEYKNGFGFADHEYWIGNDMLHKLTSLKTQELRVDMERFNGEKAYAVYSRFSVGDETSKYKLEVQGYSGNAGDSLDYNNNMKFSTLDQDNDGKSSGSCATKYRTAGWFNSCFYANPNGEYADSEKTDPKYIVWLHWKNSWISLKSIQLMIRPRA